MLKKKTDNAHIHSPDLIPHIWFFYWIYFIDFIEDCCFGHRALATLYWLTDVLCLVGLGVAVTQEVVQVIY